MNWAAKKWLPRIPVIGNIFMSIFSCEADTENIRQGNLPAIRRLLVVGPGFSRARSGPDEHIHHCVGQAESYKRMCRSFPKNADTNR